MEVGSIWGHGSYVAPDWTADWLHRESTFILDRWSRADGGKPYDAGTDEERAALRERLRLLMRANHYDAATDTLVVEPVRAEYMQGLNTTPVHGHAALFGVYGMLGLGLMFFSLRGMHPEQEWREGLLRFGFWSLNVGLFAMVVISLLPVGLMQTWAAVEHGYWYARSPEFLQHPTVDLFRWLRVIGDTIFSAGVVALVLFTLGLVTGQSIRQKQPGKVGVPTPSRI